MLKVGVSGRHVRCRLEDQVQISKQEQIKPDLPFVRNKQTERNSDNIFFGLHSRKGKNKLILLEWQRYFLDCCNGPSRRTCLCTGAVRYLGFSLYKECMAMVEILLFYDLVIQ